MNAKRSPSSKIPSNPPLFPHHHLTHSSILKLGDGGESLKHNLKRYTSYPRVFPKKKIRRHVPTFLTDPTLNQSKWSYFLDLRSDTYFHHEAIEWSSKDLPSHKEETRKATCLVERIPNQRLEAPDINLHLHLAMSSWLTSCSSLTPKSSFFLYLQASYHIT